MPTMPPARVGQSFGTPARRTDSDGDRDGSGPDETKEEFLRRRHVEWREHNVSWRFLQDSYEGGGRYRNAIYGLDHRGLPVRNLIRHKREYPNPREMQTYTSAFAAMPQMNTPAALNSYGGAAFPGQLGADPAALATDDPYEYRRARTPIPRFVGQAVNMHLSRIFGREVKRKGPASLVEWWKDVDGCGTSIDEWMKDTIGPLMLICGSLDIVFDHPENRTGEEVGTLASQKALGLDKCVASYILPDNMMWWELDCRKCYTQCLVREYHPTPQGGMKEFFRHWTDERSILYDVDGEEQSRLDHGYGRVPIVRLIGVRKFRCDNVGLPEYEEIAEIQREFYNRDSELVLSDSLHAHPLLQAPEEYCKADGEVSIGPDYLLPKKRHDAGTSVSYEGFEFIDPPQGAADSLRTNKQDLREAADRSACLAKPAGATGNSGSTVSQSGVSKEMDCVSGNDLLTRRAAQLARAERQIAGCVLLVQGDAEPSSADLKSIQVNYPSVFDLGAPGDLSKVMTEFQGILTAAGDCPDTESEILCRLLRLMVPGLDDKTYKKLDDEIALFLEDAAADKAKQKEMGLMMPIDPMNPGAPPADPSAPADPNVSTKPPVNTPANAPPKPAAPGKKPGKAVAG